MMAASMLAEHVSVRVKRQHCIAFQQLVARVCTILRVNQLLDPGLQETYGTQAMCPRGSGGEVICDNQSRRYSKLVIIRARAPHFAQRSRFLNWSTGRSP